MFGVAYAQGQAAASSGGWQTFIPLILMIVIFYFLLIRPQQKKEKQRQSMIRAIQKGDRVILAGGIYGTVTTVKEDIVVVRIATNTNVEFAKSSIQTKIS